MIYLGFATKNFRKISVYQNFIQQRTVMTSTKELLFSKLGVTAPNNDDKVTVVGCGEVGTTVAICTVVQELSSDIVLVDAKENKMEGAVKDIQQGSSYMHSKIRSSTDFTETAGSKVCVIAAGARQLQGETRMDVLNKNAEIMRGIIPKLVKYSPNTVLVMVTNPVDVMTWMAWKISGLPKHKVLGTGTILDSARFSYFIGEKLGVSANSVDGLIVGEHGDSNVAVWSHVNVSGIRLRDINPCIATPDDKENWKAIHKQVIEAGGELIKLKGFTNWAIGICTSVLIKCILKNSNKVLPVSTYIKGHCGIEHEVFLSLPAVIGKNGVSHIVNVDLNTEERCQLKFSAHKLLEAQCQINL